jgi:uncharacterized lipoprotein YmbA
MNLSLIYRVVAVCAACLFMNGCSLMHSSKGITPRSFVLTPVPAVTPPAQGRSTNMIVGMKDVKMPDYLSEKAFAMRTGTNEIVYLDSIEWAERLGSGLQRVLAADIGNLLPTEQVRLSMWGSEEVAVEVEVNVELFDVDSHGQGVLIAWWRILSPGGEKVLASGRFSATRQGPPPNKDPRGAAALMSNLATQLAENLVRAIRRPEA